MNEIEKLNATLGQIERIAKFTVWSLRLLFGCLALILSGALWAARTELRLNELDEWRAGAAADIKDHAKSLENIKGRMGIAATRPPEQSPAIVWKHDDHGDEQPTQ